MTTGKTYSPEELAALRSLHKKWWYGEEGGQRANLGGAHLAGASLVRANLDGASLVRANLTEANLVGANLVRANLTGASLVRANLTEANLTEANLTGANLTGANLTEANLVRANLTEANLDGANLVRANLTGASLDGANLVRANLVRANLAGANLVRANLDGATLPNGVRWDVYLAELVPALLTAGGKGLLEVANERVWACHSWDNCPMAEAFTVHSPEHVPPLYRWEARLFVNLFDARLIPLSAIPGTAAYLEAHPVLVPTPEPTDGEDGA